MSTPTALNAWAPRALAALRIMTALLFIEHGTQKLLAFPIPSPMGTPALASLPGIAGLLEIVGGALVVIGLFTRPVAFLLSGQMAIAYFLAHGSRSFWPVVNGGDAAILFCFIFFYLVFSGPGAWSVDGTRR